MRCCENCFTDKVLRGLAFKNSTETGNCSYCNSINVKVVDPEGLAEIFLPLIEIYEIDRETSEESSESDFIQNKLQNDWDIFNKRLSPDIQNKILNDIFSRSDYIDKSVFDKKVVLQPRILEDDLSEYLEEEWYRFKNEIIYNNRFFLGENINLVRLRDSFQFLQKIYEKDEKFYRARISNKDGHPKDKMTKPPAEKSPSGRANPEGIPYLYLSRDIKTVIYECRAIHLDYVTIAHFDVKEELKVVQLSKIENVSPFQFGDELPTYLKTKKYLKRLEEELSKPLRRNDNIIDYLPTQYLCEYVKSLGYDAIEYGSSLHSEGVNLAVFNDQKLKPKNTQVHEVLSFDLETKVVE